MLLVLLLVVAPPELDARVAELEARARAHHDAGEHVQAANGYVALSSLPGVDVDDALGRAHLDLEAAFAATRETTHLCRALRLARGRLAHTADDDEQKRLSWQETVADDLEQLKAFGGEASCPPARPPQVPLLAVDSPPRVPAPQSPPKVETDPTAGRAERRLRARRAAGMTLTGVGVGLAGLMSAALVGYAKGYEAIRAAGAVPDEVMYTSEQETALRGLHDNTRMAQGLAVGLGIASAATLATGIGLLVSHRQAARRMALLPASVPRGGGLALRFRF